MDEIVNDAASADTEVIRLDVKDDPDHAATNTKQTFHLEEVYQSHRDYIYELIWKFQAYDEHKIETFYNDFKTIFSSEDEVRALVFGQYGTSRDMHKRPLSKLTQDILDDCKIHVGKIDG